MRLLVIVLLSAIVSGCSQNQDKAATLSSMRSVDTLYYNGTIWSGLDGMPDASMLATKDGKIVYVGDGQGVNFDAALEQDLGGHFMMPGFIDNHVHFIDGGAGLASVNLRDASTPDEFVRRIDNYASSLPAGRWVLNGNWDHQLWGGELPTRQWIDEVTGDTPVFVMRIDWHMGLANSAALKLAGIDAQSVSPDDGEIVRDTNGDPTGILKDGAMNAVLQVIPERTDEETLAAINAAQQHALSLGLVEVHAMPATPTDRTLLKSFRLANKAGELKMRVYVMTPLEFWQEARDDIAINGRQQGKLRWGGMKSFVDGALGSATAWFHEPYTDNPESSGFPLTPPEKLKQQIQSADAAGLRLGIHAIGDRAIDAVIKEMQATAGKSILAHRFRIEHFQHPSNAAIAAAAQSGIIAAMQPYHAIDDGRWAEKRIGAERIKTTYAFRTILDNDGLLSFGSDWPVAPLSPMEGVYAAVTRRTIDGANPDGWQPQEKITPVEALTAYTSVNAYAGFEENQTGTLEPGKRADLVILSNDPRHIDPVKIRDITVLATIIDGEAVYRRSPSTN